MATSDFIVKNGARVTSNLVIGSAYLGSAAPVNGAIFQGPVGIGTAAPTGAGNLQVAGNIVLANTTVRSGLVFTDQTIQYSESVIGSLNQKNATTGAGPASTSVFSMQGLAITFTPLISQGNILCVMSGYLTTTATTVNTGIILQIAYGTGVTPSNSGAATGTVVGPAMEFTLQNTATAAADVHQPFTIQAIISNLTPGTTYWIDLQAKAVTTVSVFSINSLAYMVVDI